MRVVRLFLLGYHLFSESYLYTYYSYTDHLERLAWAITSLEQTDGGRLG